MSITGGSFQTCVVTLLIATFSLGIYPVRAEDASSVCDRLASSPLDTSRPAGLAGVEQAQIDAAVAIPACTEAYERGAPSPRIVFQLARVFRKAGDVAKAKALYLEASKAGHAVAMVNLAAMIEDSEPEQALDWYRKSAELGSALGQYNLGVAYQNGMGGPVDADKAIEFYRKALDQGDSFAAYNLAVLYDEGTLVDRDMVQAIKLYEVAVKGGNVDAMVNLAITLEKGDGVTADKAAALALFEQAAALGDLEAVEQAARLRKAD
ncbi:sel1 repeat family protein [Rhizobium sp. KAs_5_22]|nr:sel1 repeat family protein [Rhizobium sp. KAs_5_22]